MLLPMVSCFHSSGNANNHSSFECSVFHVWNDEWLLALPDEWKHETIGSNMAVLF